MASKPAKPKYLIVGEILRPHGVKGEFRMRILTDYPERLIKKVKTIYVGDSTDSPALKLYNIESARLHQEYLLLKFTEIQDRNEADLLRGKFVLTAIENAVPLEEDEYYLYEVIGLTVVTDDGRTLGTIKEVMETGANDVYVVDSRQYGELLLPVLDELILDINFEESRITIHLMDGLLPDSSTE